MQVLWSADASKTSGLGELEFSSPQATPKYCLKELYEAKDDKDGKRYVLLYSVKLECDEHLLFDDVCFRDNGQYLGRCLNEA